MAKKKVAKQEDPPKTNSDLADKLASLKTLNDLLVRETIERRDQVHALVLSNEQSESEIAHYKAENHRLEAEKCQCEEQIVALELDRSLSLVFVSSELEQRDERSKKCIKNAEKMAAREAQMNLAMTQKAKVAEAKVQSMRGEKEELIARIDLLHTQMKESVRDKVGQEIKMKELRKEVDQLGYDLDVSKGDLDRIVRERDGAQKGLDLLKEEANGLRLIVSKMEKNNEDARKEIRQLQIERDVLVEEKMKLVKSLGSLQQSLEEYLRRLNDLETEKDEIEKARTKQDIKITQLLAVVDVLTTDLSRSRDDFDCLLCERDAVQKDLVLRKDEVDGLALKVVQLEESNQMFRDECNGLVEERKERERELESLMDEKKSIEVRFVESSQLIEDLEQKMKEIVGEKEEVDRVRLEQEAKILELQAEARELSATISVLQVSYEGLAESNNRLQAVLHDRNDAFDRVLCERDTTVKNLDLLKKEEEGLRTKVYNLEKNNAEVREKLVALLTEFGGGVGVIEGDMKEKMGPIVAEVGAIERAFKDREGKIEDMKREMGFLKVVAAEAQKKRSLWAWVSAATTTVFAAASVAYAAKGH